jgi:hypothetical protein
VLSSAALKFSGLFLAYVTAIHLVDGPWRRWKKGREGDALDPWTLSHVASGFIANRMGVGEGEFMALGVVNEVAELWIRENRPDLLWGEPESPGNVAADIAANWLGYKLGGLT